MKISLIRAASKLALLASVLVSTVAVAQTAVTVKGKVNGSEGPKQFASVKLEGPGRYLATTDAEGRFEIPNVVPGKYTVEVRKEDHRDVSTRDIGSDPLDLQVKW